MLKRRFQWYGILFACFACAAGFALLMWSCSAEEPVAPAAPDKTPPTVVSTSPADADTMVVLAVRITATFSEEIDTTTLKPTTFLMSGGVTGDISYANKVATFTPSAELDSNTVYTATLTTGIKDRAGNFLASDFSWSFRTLSSAENQKPVADAGPDQDVNTGSVVNLDGGGSSDPEGATLAYVWTQVLGPDVTGGQGTLTGVAPSFTSPSEVATVQFDLVVNDGIKESDPERVQINVMEDKDLALFVSPDGDNGNPGTRDEPLKDLTEAIQQATSSGADVYMAGGMYQPPNTVGLVDGVSIYGGFRRADWARTGADVTTIDVQAATAMSADAITGQTILDGVTVQSVDSPNPGGSVYGIRVKNSFGLVIRHCVVQAGVGGDGTDGAAFSGPATAGGNGGLGQPGCENSTGLCNTCPRPLGGVGGTSSGGRPGGSGGRPRDGDLSGDAGQPGGGGTAGGPGTPPYRGNWDPLTQYWGANGANGSTGNNGAAGSEGLYTENGYTLANASDGGAGGPGNGGGGGGGGGGGANLCDSYGGGGGGGGGGGEGGQGGVGGTSGGASIALYLWGSNIRVEDCELVTDGGGDGGAGASGQAGGAGGAGGAVGTSGRGNIYGGTDEQDDGSNGARGGNGGNGGNGGAGGGAAGGPSIGLFRGGGSNPVLVTITYNVGLAGSGGASSGNPGPAGRRSNQYSQ